MSEATLMQNLLLTMIIGIFTILTAWANEWEKFTSRVVEWEKFTLPLVIVFPISTIILMVAFFIFI